MKSAIALEAYEKLAEAYASRIDTKPHNAYYERPATISLLPNLKGKRVLDAGCGPGVYTEWLLKNGSDVVAIDNSPKMVALAKKRVGDKAKIIQADIGEPLFFLKNETFDIVISTLALDYVENWKGVFEEFYRILVKTGYLIISIGHPLADFIQNKSDNYFKTELVEWEWKGFGLPVRVPYYRRPFNAAINPLLKSGFNLECILEPLPLEQFGKEDPKGYDELLKRPGFLCIRAIK
jgi:SAM-dependent methyltransferase